MADFDVFISYARRDGAPLALKLAQKLREQQLRVFWDQDSIPAGANWDQTLDDALESAEHLVVILTPVSVQSEEVTAEWRPMLSKGKNIIPVLYRPCEIPRRLTMRQYIDFQDENRFPVAFSELVAALSQHSLMPIELEISGQELLKRGYVYFQNGQQELSARDYVSALNDANVEVRLQAARMLGAAKVLRFVGDMVAALRRETDSAVKSELLIAFWRIAETTDWRSAYPQLATELLQFLTDESASVREEAIRVFAFGRIITVVPNLIELLADDAAGSVRRQAALSLGRLGQLAASDVSSQSVLSDIADALNRALGDSDSNVRRASARACGVLHVRKALDRLKALARSDRVSEVRLAAAEAVTTIQGQKT